MLFLDRFLLALRPQANKMGQCPFMFKLRDFLISESVGVRRMLSNYEDWTTLAANSPLTEHGL